MNVRIWDIKKEKWFSVDNIKHIYQSVGKTYFKLDCKEYSTHEYDLSFIHSEA